MRTFHCPVYFLFEIYRHHTYEHRLLLSFLYKFFSNVLPSYQYQNFFPSICNFPGENSTKQASYNYKIIVFHLCYLLITNLK